MLALIKLPIAALMLWIPFRYDECDERSDPPGPSEDDGGSRALPAGPLDPRPRRPLPGDRSRGARAGARTDRLLPPPRAASGSPHASVAACASRTEPPR